MGTRKPSRILLRVAAMRKVFESTLPPVLLGPYDSSEAHYPKPSIPHERDVAVGMQRELL
jgi:hypothetical protein